MDNEGVALFIAAASLVATTGTILMGSIKNYMRAKKNFDASIPDIDPMECDCATGHLGHRFGSIGCEYYDHHCDACHSSNICTGNCPIHDSE